MIKIYFKKLEYLLNLKEGLNFVNIENTLFYRDLYFNLFEKTIISLDNIELNLSSIFRINNVLDFNINDKKNIFYLYKNLENDINLKYNEKLLNLFNNTISLIKDAAIDLGINFDYDESFSLDKLFQSLSIKYIEEDDFLCNFINNILNINKFYNFKLIIIFNFSSFFDNSEMELINSEFQKQGIIILCINPLNNVGKTKEIEPIFIDEDMCII